MNTVLCKRSQIPFVCGLLILVRELINVLNREVEFIFVPLRVAAILAAAVGQRPQQLDLVAVKEGEHTIIEEIGGHVGITTTARDEKTQADIVLLDEGCNVRLRERRRASPAARVW